MNVNDLKRSKFLTKQDVGRGVLATISVIIQQDVSPENEPEDLRYTMEFEEFEKPLVLNSTNGQLIAQITGSDESDDWIGHKIVLYDDPTISYKGKITGGIRVRAPKPGSVKAAPAQRPPEPEPQDEGLDDLPF